MAAAGKGLYSCGYLIERTEIQVHIHDSECHPLKEVKSCDLAFKVSAFSVKEPDLRVEIQEKELSQRGYHIGIQDSAGRVYKEGTHLVYSCQVENFREIVLKIEVIGAGHVIFPCKLLSSKHEKLCLTIIGNNGIYNGVFQFECLVITPWRNEAMKCFDLANIQHWHPDPVDGKRSLEMGHRGCGSTHGKSRSPSTPVENTIASFTKAFEKGADYVELDVQLTKDLVPIVFHDFFTAAFITERNSDIRRKVEIAVNALTLNELKKLQFTFTGELNQVNVKDEGGVADKLTADLFPTLEQVLKDSPANLGIFIELKFPMQEKSGLWESDRHVNKNQLIEKTLDVVYSKAGKRRIIFGSFDPSVCTMLKLKQPFYEVVMITSGENDIYPMCMDHRCRTLKMAMSFALSENLLGISVMSDPIVNTISDVFTEARSHNLELFTWGNANVNQEFIEHQKKLGITGIIYDRLHELRS